MATSSHVFQRPCYDRISPNALSQITALYNLSLEGLQQHTRQYKEPLTFNIAGWHPCEESERFFVSSHSGTIVILIHAPSRKRQKYCVSRKRLSIFQSTPSHGGRHESVDQDQKPHPISIRALRRMEGDMLPSPSRKRRPHFNPRPPHGERRVASSRIVYALFQSTPSAWRATGAKSPLVIQRFSKAFSRTSKMPSCSPQEISS